MSDRIEPRESVSAGPRFSLRALLLFVGAACVLVAGLAWFNRRMDEFGEAIVLGAPGPIETENELPEALKPLVGDPLFLKLDGKQLAVHCLESGLAVHCLESGWDAEYICKIESDAQLRDLIITQFGLSSVSISPWSLFASKRKFTKSQTPSWQIPTATDADAYFASAAFMSRLPGHRYEMLYNADARELHLHHYFDF
jgi:hypothetical protein